MTHTYADSRPDTFGLVRELDTSVEVLQNSVSLSRYRDSLCRRLVAQNLGVNTGGLRREGASAHF